MKYLNFSTDAALVTEILSAHSAARCTTVESTTTVLKSTQHGGHNDKLLGRCYKYKKNVAQINVQSTPIRVTLGLGQARPNITDWSGKLSLSACHRMLFQGIRTIIVVYCHSYQSGYGYRRGEPSTEWLDGIVSGRCQTGIQTP